MLLESQLTFSQQFSPIYSKGLANHLPMAIIALDGIGASTDQIDVFINSYKDKLERIGEYCPSITEKNWNNFLGQRAYFKAYYQYFTEAIAQQGFKNVLYTHVDQLAPGICTSAFHSLIRLGLGVKIRDMREIASALAFWSSEYQTLGELQHSDTTIDYKNDLEALAGNLASCQSLQEDPFDAPNIILRLDKVSKHTEFQKIVGGVSRLEIDIGSLADFSLRLFASTKSFTALHGVTSCHALRILNPYIGDQKLVMRYYAQALLAAYISIQSPKILHWSDFKLFETAGNSWRHMFKQAILSSNDHKIKMVFSCYEEYLYYNDIAYKYCALLALDSNI